jgi:CBS domain-containing protein
MPEFHLIHVKGHSSAPISFIREGLLKRAAQAEQCALASPLVWRYSMKARDVMVAPVITAQSNASIKSVAETFVRHRISAVPVLDDKGKVVGMISEGDLLHRAETGTERRRPWWLRAFLGPDALANEYTKAHARKVTDAMTSQVITASPETPLHEIAALLERHSIKRVPIVENGQLVGIVSRANLVQAMASAGKRLEIPLSDSAIRAKLLSHLNAQSWAYTGLLNVIVDGGVVDLYGLVRSDSERRAIRVAAEGTPGVQAVNDNMRLWPVGAYE